MVSGPLAKASPLCRSPSRGDRTPPRPATPAHRVSRWMSPEPVVAEMLRAASGDVRSSRSSTSPEPACVVDAVARVGHVDEDVARARDRVDAVGRLARAPRRTSPDDASARHRVRPHAARLDVARARVQLSAPARSRRSRRCRRRRRRARPAASSGGARRGRRRTTRRRARACPRGRGSRSRPRTSCRTPSRTRTRGGASRRRSTCASCDGVRSPSVSFVTSSSGAPAGADVSRTSLASSITSERTPSNCRTWVVVWRAARSSSETVPCATDDRPRSAAMIASSARRSAARRAVAARRLGGDGAHLTPPGRSGPRARGGGGARSRAARAW